MKFEYMYKVFERICWTNQNSKCFSYVCPLVSHEGWTLRYRFNFRFAKRFITRTHTHVTNSRDTKMQWMEKIQFTKQRNPETTIRNTKYYSIPRNLISIEFLRSKPNFLRNIVEIMAEMALKWTKQTTNQVCQINAK